MTLCRATSPEKSVAAIEPTKMGMNQDMGRKKTTPVAKAIAHRIQITKRFASISLTWC